MFGLEHFKGSQQNIFQLGSSLCEPLFLQKGVTPREKKWKKIELRNDINCNRFVFKKYSNDVQRILFEFF